MKDKNENVFNNDEVIGAYTKYILPTDEVYKKSAEYIFSTVSNFTNILDIGCGKGDFSLHLIKLLERNNIEYRYDGFDVSKEMITCYKKQITDNNINMDAVNLWVDDVLFQIPNLVKSNKEKYDVVIITFVLHYFKNWNSLLQEIKKLLKPGGVLIQTSAYGHYSLLVGCNRMIEDTPSEVVNFWMKLFNLKENLNFENRWVNFIDILELSDVREYLENELSFSLEGSRFFSWQKFANLGTLLDWIRISPISPISGGLTDDQKTQLKDAMEKWLIKNKYDLKTVHKLPGYLKLFIHKKTTNG